MTTAVDSTALALTLAKIKGIGRVTANRILAHFRTYEDLQRYPREQVMARLRGAPNLARLIGTLYDAEVINAMLKEAAAFIETLSKKQIQLITRHHDRWPAGLNELTPAKQPLVLYCYGHLSLLNRPAVTFLWGSSLDPTAEKKTRLLINLLRKKDIVPVAEAMPASDIFLKHASHPESHRQTAILVTPCGLGKLDKTVRLIANRIVKAGGLLLSAYSMDHGPFLHDRKDTALILTALTGPTVYMGSDKKIPQWRAVTWGIQNGRSVFVTSPTIPPETDHVHYLQNEVDFEWVVAAASSDS